MVNRVEIKVRLKIVLATEQFQGHYHTGQSTTAYMLNHPVTIFTQGDSDKMRWMQGRDQNGHFENRLPPNGLVVINQGECQLLDNNNKLVATLSSFAAPVISYSGTAEYKYKRSTYSLQKDSQINWVGRGVWELVADRSDTPAPNYVQSRWSFNTSASTGVGGLVVEFGQGTLVLDDPSKITHRFAYIGGGGSVDLGKVLKLIKALKNLTWVEKVAKATGAVTQVSGGSSTEDMFSTGAILKNALVVGARELTVDDFLGQCVWIDASIGMYKSIGGMILLTNFDVVLNVPVFSAIIPCAGVNYTPVAAGVGACTGWISPG